MPDETPAPEPAESAESRSREEDDPSDDVRAHRKEHEPAKRHEH